MNERIKELAAKVNFTEQDFEDMPGLMMFAQLIWEEAYEKGHDEGYEQAVLKERG